MIKQLLIICSVVTSVFSSAQTCGNLNFETGNYSGWALNTFLNMNTATMQTCCATPGSTSSIIVNTPYTTSYMNVLPHSPFGGTKVAMIGDSTGNTFGTRATYSFVVSGNTLQYAIAPVSTNPGAHTCSDDTYNAVIVRNSGGTAFYTNQMVPASSSGTCTAGGSVFTSTASNTHIYGCWSTFSVNVSAYIGQAISMEVIAANCTGGGHWDYCFFDAVCTSVTPTIIACGFSTDIKETVISSNEISIWPNPATHMLHLGIDSNQNNSELIIYDLLGNVVIKQNELKETNSISIEKLVQGAYLYKVIIDNALVKTGKFIKE